MYNLAGYGVGEANVRFRVYGIFFFGVIAFGSLLYWRAQLLTTADYVELPDHKMTPRHNVLIPKTE